MAYSAKPIRFGQGVLAWERLGGVAFEWTAPPPLGIPRKPR
jgi:hypothetical protein